MQIYGNSYKPNKKQLSVLNLSLVYLLMMKTENFFFLFNYLHFKEKCEKKAQNTIFSSGIKILNKLFHTLANQNWKNVTSNNVGSSSKSANEIRPPNDLNTRQSL